MRVGGVSDDSGLCPNRCKMVSPHLEKGFGNDFTGFDRMRQAAGVNDVGLLYKRGGKPVDNGYRELRLGLFIER
ncbi:MAG: hypothetical protein NPIRA05_12280 [Nitrospirales bacterium]|nr:MAG: hypothetical protein NPIRA05_12280 [Nitrospirales bacterium]